MLAALLCNIGGTPATVAPPSGGKGDNPRRPSIFKPTGLLERRVKKPAPHHETLEEILEIPVVAQPATSLREVPIPAMSMAEIDFEIKYLMTKLYRTQEEEDILIILLIASNA